MLIPFLPKFEPVRATSAEGTRSYKTPIGSVPSVTTILSGSRDNSGIAAWRDSIGEEKADKIVARACWRGDLHHDNLENYLVHGIEPNLNFVTEKYWKSTIDFYRTIHHTLLCEGQIWHPAGYAGAFDCLAYLSPSDEQPTLVDHKTADKPKKPDAIYEYKLQAAAYVAGCNHVYKSYGLDIQQAKIVVAIANDHAQIETLDRDTLDQLYYHFLARIERFYIK
mgnify:CR=1 FL=1